MNSIAMTLYVYYYYAMDEFTDDINSGTPEDTDDVDAVDLSSDIWEEDNSSKLRKPDFSDVRKKVRNPWKIAIFLIISSVIWYFFYYFGTKYILMK